MNNKRKFRMQLIEETHSGDIAILSEGIAELSAVDLKKDFGIDAFQLIAEQLIKEAEDIKN